MRLLCAGEAFEDLIFVGLDRLPGPGEEVKTDRFVATVGGGAVITAVQAARLGARVDLLSALGPSSVARVKSEHITIHNLLRKGEAHAVSAALSTTDERSFVTFNGANAKLESRLARTLSHLGTQHPGTQHPGTQHPGTQHLHLCFYPHNCGQWARIVEKLRKRGITTSWDFGWNEPLTNDRGLIDLIDSLDFLFVNELEARLYTGEAELSAALDHWRARQAIVIVKLGENGSLWLAPGRDVHAPAPRVKVVDTTGAGDAFNAGFLYAWMHGQPPAKCLALGNKVGAASTRHAGGI
ncbi:MAG: carbohydrate kinase family protein [Vicinamibacterales bacterium]